MKRNNLRRFFSFSSSMKNVWRSSCREKWLVKCLCDICRWNKRHHVPSHNLSLTKPKDLNFEYHVTSFWDSRDADFVLFLPKNISIYTQTYLKFNQLKTKKNLNDRVRKYFELASEITLAGNWKINRMLTTSSRIKLLSCLRLTLSFITYNLNFIGCKIVVF